MTIEANEFTKAVEVYDSGKGANPYNQPVHYWRITYRFYTYSIYFDIDDTMGPVGVPYFEILVDNDTVRYVENDKSELIKCIDDLCQKQDQEILEYPERFL